MNGKKADIIIFDEVSDTKKPDKAEKAGQTIGHVGGVIVLILVFALIIIGLLKFGCWLLML